MPVSNKETAADVAALLTKIRKWAEELGIQVLSLGSDSAAVEISAKKLSIADPAVRRHEEPISKYTLDDYGFEVETPVFRNGAPLIEVPDPLHAAKSLRNFLLGGAKFPMVGRHSTSFALVDRLLDLPGKVMLTTDLHNADRQDDGAAARLFSAETLGSMLKKEENGDIVIREGFQGLFILLQVLGESSPFGPIQTTY